MARRLGAGGPVRILRALEGLARPTRLEGGTPVESGLRAGEPGAEPLRDGGDPFIYISKYRILTLCAKQAYK